MEKYQFNEIEFSFMEKSSIPFAVYQFIDKRVVTLVVSAGFCHLFGFERREAYDLMDNDMYRDTHPDDVARIANDAFLFATENRKYNVIYRSKVKGVYGIIHAHGEHIYTEDGTRLAVVWYDFEGTCSDDVSEYESGLNHSLNTALREESMYQRNYYDQLTGLPTMTYFFELAEAGRKRLQERGKQTAFLFINLKGMSYFNKKYGFNKGDQLINAVAKILIRYFSNENCSRFAQDHFAVFTDAENLEEKLEKIISECQKINDGNNLPVRIGIYAAQNTDVDISTACDRAKYACDVNREAYMSGYYYFDDTMLANTESQQYIIDNLDRAMAENWIKVYYQAIVRTANGKVCDEEALARWDDPVKGLLSPGEFIPILEDTKLIYKLDLYMLDQILKKMKAQADYGLYIVPQSLNLSRADFDMCDIVEEIRKRVDGAGIARDKLTIEITESVVGSDFEFMKDQIRRFQKLGFQVWMDDFGSGYSSLDLLQNIHFDLIKFDMRFMQRFGQGEESKIILTELMKMASGLGIDTVTEGVETREQVDFLREVGCSKLQGFYFSKPVPLETIVERNRKGIQIGFENPEEADYYAAIGKINLYDQAVLAQDNPDTIQQYFNTIPMAILETSQDEFRITRCNKSYREYMEKAFGISVDGKSVKLVMGKDGSGSAFLNTVKQCGKDGITVMVDEETRPGETTHALVKRIAVNPVTGTAALAVAVLAVIGNQDQRPPITYALIARALSSDYRSLYYVDLNTEHFIEYSSEAMQGNLSVERHGENFFEASRNDALQYLHEADQEKFISSFTKEFVVHALDEHGTFTLTYRLLIDGEYRYVNMKAVRMSPEDHHIIIGVNDVDGQMKQQEALERIRLEQIAYARITALSDEYICIYTVDPETDHYLEYSATRDYEGLGLAKEGENFFYQALIESLRTICREDQEMFSDTFIKENVLEGIRNSRRFEMKYRLMIDGAPRPVRLKAAMVEELEGQKLIIGVSKIETGSV